MPSESFGAYLRRRRNELRLTQKEVEDRGGPSQTYLSDLEKSADTDKPITPSRKMVQKIARGLGVSVEEVEKAAGYLPGTTEAETEIVPPPGMWAARLSTGDIIFVRQDDPDPEATITAAEAWFQGWRAKKTPTLVYSRGGDGSGN